MNRLKQIYLVLFVLILFFGSFYIYRTWNENIKTKTNEVVKIARVAETILPKEALDKLNADETDLQRVEYQHIKSNLTKLVSLDGDTRFAYIYVVKNNKIFFVADSESVGAKDYSPPGQEYTEASPEYFIPYTSGQFLVTKPVTDRWGKWISVLVPIKNPASGQIQAVFAMDYSAENWNNEAILATVQSSVIVLVLFLLLLTFYRITENNAEVREREKNFRMFFDTIDDIIIVGNKTGEIYYVNKACHLKLGFTTEDLKSMKVLDLNPKESRKEAEKIFADMFAGKLNVCPLPLQKKDGSLLPVETHVWFGKWNGKDSIFGIAKDLSHEQELLQKFNKIFDNNPALMAISSYPDRILTDVNNTFIERTGYTKEEVVGKTSKEIGFFPNSKQASAIAEGLKKNGFIRNYPVQVKTKSGEILDGLFYGETIESQNKKYFLTLLIDITEIRKAEKSKEQAQENLKEKIDQLEKINKAMVGRELKMVELKRKFDELKNES